jgi:TIGR03009 family protein
MRRAARLMDEAKRMMRSNVFHAAALLAALAMVGSLGTVARAQSNPAARSPSAQPQPARPPVQAPRGPVAPPPGFNITAEQQKWIDDILNYWQVSSAKVSTYSTSFIRWEYNPAFVRDPNTPWTEAAGVIRFAQPDKAMYRVDEVKYYEAPQRPGERPTYLQREGDAGEYWVCDGKSIMEFDGRNKQVRKQTIPAEMQGAAIANGPLPFLFGAEAAKLKQRYWFKPLPPPKDAAGKFIEGEYWLAAKPKFRDDAANYELVEIIIDQKEFLPKAMQIYLPGGKERKVFEFTERTKNPRLALIMPHFASPAVPRGWTVVNDNGGAPPVGRALAPTTRDNRAAWQLPASQNR